MPASASELRVAWRPQEGPQTLLLLCPYDDIFYGGARGGGKTSGILGHWAKHAHEFGRHARGILFRRTYDELEEVIEQASQIYPLLGAYYNAGKRTWHFPNGARLKLRYMDKDKDAKRYQGHQYCVAVGTRIRMADGSLKPIERIQVGELVQTLEGPQAVTDTVKPYEAACVRARVYSAEGDYVGEQVQPVWHPLLTSAGLHHGPSADSPHSDAQSPDAARDLSIPAERSPVYAGSGSLDWRAYEANGRSGDIVSSDSLSRTQLPPGLSFPVVLHAPAHPSGDALVGFYSSRRSAALCKLHGSSLDSYSVRPWERTDRWRPHEHGQSMTRNDGPRVANALAYAPDATHTTSGCQSRCARSSDCHDALAHVWLGIDQDELPSRDDVATRLRVARRDARDTTPIHRGHQRTYRHPYTGEARDLSEDYTVGRVELNPCGISLVADITVNHVNHYITESGLVNKNTWIGWEELTNWPSPDPIDKLNACLRSVHGVRCQKVSTGNPGGVGHNWVRARYIDPMPPFTPYLDPVTNLIRIFIPAKLQDNKLLMQNDPRYVDRLKDSGPEWLVKAWLEGDWNIVAGGMFDDLWKREIHIIEPFKIPTNWTIDRAFDWGSSAPFSIGWWAESNGEFIPPPVNRMFYKGTKIRIAEWYGWNGKPNKGLNMIDTEIARKGLEMEQALTKAHGYQFVEGPADPSIFNTTNGVNIAEGMGAIGLTFQPASAGAGSRKSGWELMRRMMKAAAKSPMEEAGLFVFSSCRQFIRTVPMLPRDTKNLDDVDTDAEDHIGDETRYELTYKRREVKMQKLVGV